jgi:vacuolar iron transporter family protein
MPEQKDLARYRANLQDEINSASLYRTFAETESQPELAELYRRMADMEERHAGFWRQKLHAAGAQANLQPDWRSRTLAWLARRFGVRFLLPTMVDMERAGQHTYDRQPEARAAHLPAAERSHARLLETVERTTRSGISGSALARFEGRHQAVGGNALRAAVLGANDGLLSNLSLIMGVAGAALPARSIMVTGLAGLLAGACSMAIGEWISVQSSRELNQRQLDIEAAEIAEVPEEEMEELALIFEAKGLHKEEARTLATRVIENQENSLDILSREELGIDPEELGGSPWEAAVASFLLFSVGAVIPLAPFLWLSRLPAVVASLGLSALAMFVIGASITLVTGKDTLVSGMRQMLFGMTAAGLTFAIGRLIGGGVVG